MRDILRTGSGGVAALNPRLMCGSPPGWPGEPKGAFEVPWIVPLAGAGICGLLIFNTDAKPMRIAMLLLVGITVLYLITRPREISEEVLSHVAHEPAAEE